MQTQGTLRRPTLLIWGDSGNGTRAVCRALQESLGENALTQPAQHKDFVRQLLWQTPKDDGLVIVSDAQGTITETLQQYLIEGILFGAKHILIAIVVSAGDGFNADAHSNLVAGIERRIRHFQFENCIVVPIMPPDSGNIVTRSPEMSWYEGPTISDWYEGLSMDGPVENPARMIVRRAVSGEADIEAAVVSGTFNLSDDVSVEPDGANSRIMRLATPDGDQETVDVGETATLQLTNGPDVSLGDIIRNKDTPMDVTDQVQAHVLWLSDTQMIPGRHYAIKMATREAIGWVSDLRYKIDFQTHDHLAGKTLTRNEVAVCNLSFDRRLACEPFADCNITGAFEMIDNGSGEVVGLGKIDFALRRAKNLTRQKLNIAAHQRAEALGQMPSVIWFTGLSGAGKSTLANELENQLHARGRHTYMLDGDNIRHGLNRDLGFTDVDRVENIRRMAEVARLFADAGLIVLVSAISPFRSDREMARSLMPDGEFLEVHVDATLATCEARDPKGLYARARAGEIVNFTGIDSPYEAPENPDLRIDTDELSPEEAAKLIVDHLEERN